MKRYSMAMTAGEYKDRRTGFEVAVIGMAGRFPGAPDISRLWNNLKNGVESIYFLGDGELRRAGLSEEQLSDPGLVRSRGGVLEEADRFDAPFFGYTPKEARSMDPQFRLLHECAWHALEDAGYDPYSYEGAIGIYAGCSGNFGWQALTVFAGEKEGLGEFVGDQLMERDFLSTRVSYALNLRGPSLVVQTACSTSLVAVHLACRALLTGECDLALAGGVSINLTGGRGYVYRQGMTLSVDGHCRAFDAGARGMIGGEGGGLAVLKRLRYAVADRDFIHAVILGSAVNNDGAARSGFTAPSVESQVGVIRTAHRIAGIEAESIGYIEAHGTGTELGDPIEVEALNQAFDTEKRDFCALGSVKTNIGHLDAAAGIVSFIKTVLVLKNKQIPPSLHFESPNPQVDFTGTPFYVNTGLQEWKSHRYPRRAGVSSFGIGGTNAHVVLEEAPAEECGVKAVSLPGARPYRLILLSGSTPSALDQVTRNLCDYLQQNPGVDLADAAYTLQVGRRPLAHRRAVVGASIGEVVAALSVAGAKGVVTGAAGDKNRPLVFVFAGLGSQYVNMGLGLYQGEPVFAGQMDRCFAILKSLMGYDIKEMLYPGIPAERAAGTAPMESEVAQPLVFAFEYALTHLLISWGIRPTALIGYSFGEYTAACVSGVFSLEDALALIVSRSRLIQTLPPGLMLSVPLSAGEIEPLLTDGLAIAIDNGTSCITAGSPGAAEAFEKRLKARKVLSMRLPLSRALHTEMMAPILKEFRQELAGIRLHEPRIPYISNVTGQWITPGEAVDAGYWVNHLRQPVRFADGIRELAREPGTIFTEIGPGHDLSIMLTGLIDRSLDQQVINLVRPSQKEAADAPYLLNRLGHLWVNGKEIDWQSFYISEQRRRIPLPLYPFEGRRHTIEGDVFRLKEELVGRKLKSLPRKREVADWFYLPSWIRRALPPVKMGQRCNGLVFADEYGLGDRLAKRLQDSGCEVTVVRQGAGFKKEGEAAYTIDPRSADDYIALVDALRVSASVPRQVVHLWSIADRGAGEGEGQAAAFAWQAQDPGFFCLIYLAQALGRGEYGGAGNKMRDTGVTVTVVTNNTQEVVGGEVFLPAAAAVMGPVRVIPQEYPGINCRGIDIVFPVGQAEQEEMVGQLFLEIMADSSDILAAYRGSYRWVQHFEPLRLDKAERAGSWLRRRGVYLITGGLGAIGLALAGYLARNGQARLALTGRSELPARGEWAAWLKSHGAEDRVSVKIRKIRELEALGAEVAVYRADITDFEQMKRLILTIKDRFGGLNGVIQAAGVMDSGLIKRRSREMTEAVLKPKVTGTLILDKLLRDTELDFFVLCSSLNSFLSGPGMVAHVATSNFADSFALYRARRNGRRDRTISINWDGWQEAGMGREARKLFSGQPAQKDEEMMLSAEGVDAFCRLMECPFAQAAVSKKDLTERIEQLKAARDTELALIDTLEKKIYTETPSRQSGPARSYAAPRNEIEKVLAGIFQEILGRPRVGIYDNFFELGASSVYMARINDQLQKLLGKEISIVIMFEYPTIASLARYLTNGESESTGTGFVGKEERSIMVDRGKAKMRQIKGRSPT